MAISVILIVDRELPDIFGISGDKDFYETSLYIIQEGDLIPLNLRLFAKYCSLHNKEISFFTQSNYKEKNLIAEIDNQIGKSLRDELVAKKLNLTLNVLIDSPGGHKNPLASMNQIISFIKDRGGIINSFSFNLVASAAADLFALTDTRYCLKLTEFLCHASSSNPEIENFFDDETEEEREISKDITLEEYKDKLDKLFKGHKQEFTDRINKIKRAALSKVECDLYLKGYNMEEFGLVAKAFENFDDFNELIKRSIGKNAISKRRIDTFLNEMEQQYNEMIISETDQNQHFPHLSCPE